MTWSDHRLGLDKPPFPPPEEIDAKLKALSPQELVLGWREVSTTGLKDETQGTRAVAMYFDGLGHHEPERTVQFIEALLAEEEDDRLVALVGQGKLLGQLLHFHGAKVARSLQEMALRRPRLRFLMGSVAWSVGGGMVEDRDTKRRLLSICDQAGYEAWLAREREGRERIDFAALAMEELAPLWVAITSRSDVEKEADENASALFDFQYELVNNEPLRALALVQAILAIEDNPNLLGLLAAGLLEDLIPAEDGPVVDAVVAAAEADPKFRRLLGGVWFSRLSPAVTDRLERAREGIRW